MHKPFE